MPNLKSAFKRMRSDSKKALRNKQIQSELKTYIKKFRGCLQQNNIENASNILKILISKLDKASSRGIIHKNTASRKKSRLVKELAKVKT